MVLAQKLLFIKRIQCKLFENTSIQGISVIQFTILVHFGLGKVAVIDSIVVIWPGNMQQLIIKPL